MLFILLACAEDKAVNSFPQLEEINLSSEEPEVHQELRCLVDAMDPDGEDLRFSFLWTIAEEPAGDTDRIVLSPETAVVGETVTCTVFVQDSHDQGVEGSVSTVIANTPPVIEELRISPRIGVVTDSFLSCTAQGFDVNDGQFASTEYRWLIEDREVGRGEMLQLDSAMISPNEQLRCEVNVRDRNDGSAVLFDSITIENRPPVLEEISITPDRGVFNGTALGCQASFLDPDGDIPSLDYQWTVNGIPISNSASYVVDAVDADPGDQLLCTALARDRHGAEVSATVSVPLLNTRAEISEAQILSPSGVFFNDEILECTAEATDVDGAPTIEYSWFVGEELLALGDNIDLLQQDIFPDDRLRCVARALDPYGDSVESDAEVVIANRAPSEPSVSIDWSTGGYFIIDEDELICAGSGSVDPDRQPLSYTYEWSSDLGGSASGEILSSTNTSPEETWTCRAVASDGELSAENETSIQLSPAGDPNCDFGYCQFNLDLGAGLSFDMMLIEDGSDVNGRYELTHEYYLMTTEVTQAMFLQIMGYPSYQDVETEEDLESVGIGEEYPAHHVNWHMAADFANLITARHNQLYETSLNQCYACSYSQDSSVYCSVSYHPYYCDGYRLPTEAEWENAARSGSAFHYWSIDGSGNLDSNTCLGFARIMDGLSNPFLTDYAWNCGNNGHHGSPYGSKEVAQKNPNGYELFDLHGNLQEWTTDWQGCSYPSSIINPYCEVEATERVLRGGGWNSSPLDSSLGARATQLLHERSPYTGFRLLRMIYP